VLTFKEDKTVTTNDEVAEYTHDIKNKLLTLKYEGNDFETVKVELKGKELYIYQDAEKLSSAIKADEESDGYFVYYYLTEYFSDQKIALTDLDKAAFVETFSIWKKK
jgi:hypothetical protein